MALEGTVHKYDLPIQLFSDLITAFEQDQTVTRYQNWSELFGYCRYSANPVGRLVLRLCGYADQERDRMSDATCTALQLANFWQDVTVDYRKGPRLSAAGSAGQARLFCGGTGARQFNAAFQAVMREAVGVARKLFLEGLAARQDGGPAAGVSISTYSAAAACACWIKSNGRTTTCSPEAPAISKFERLQLLSRQPVGRIVSLEASYAFCRRVARTRARNFYYSFLLLSREQRNAMCAIYAFMRYCDDISEGDGASRAGIERLAPGSGSGASRPVCRKPALARVPRHGDALPDIPHEYFYEMIDGVSSDLEPRQIQTFDELYRYCYQVASVVGLTILHIFGFESPEAPALAEKCGIAFQLTNILRDVREDLENGRVYIPAEDISRFGADLEKRDQNFARLMSFEAARARGYYDESRPLIELVACRAAGHPCGRLSKFTAACWIASSARISTCWKSAFAFLPGKS